MTTDALGDRMKMYEAAEHGRRFMPLLPVLARLDGKCFSAFTRGLARPYDERLSRLMVEVTRFLVDETCANCGYTQSDEISLCWYDPDPKAQIWFDGRVQKMTSVLAAMATAAFIQLLPEFIEEKDTYGDGEDVAPTPLRKLPVFDCRTWQVPTLDEAANAFLWREQDATKNSISMAAQSHYSHKELDGKSGAEKQEMLFRKGVNWNDYPAFFKRGTYVRRRTVRTRFADLTPEQQADLPPLHNARKNPQLEVERSEVAVLPLPPLSRVANRAAVLLAGAEPVAAED